MSTPNQATGPTGGAGQSRPAISKNVPLTEIVQSAIAAAESDKPATCPYPAWSAAATCWCQVYSAEMAALTVRANLIGHVRLRGAA